MDSSLKVLCAGLLEVFEPPSSKSDLNNGHETPGCPARGLLGPAGSSPVCRVHSQKHCETCHIGFYRVMRAILDGFFSNGNEEDKKLCAKCRALLDDSKEEKNDQTKGQTNNKTKPKTNKVKPETKKTEPEPKNKTQPKSPAYVAVPVQPVRQPVSRDAAPDNSEEGGAKEKPSTKPKTRWFVSRPRGFMKQPVKAGAGKTFPTRFVPPSDSVSPSELFSGKAQFGEVLRYVLPNDPGTMLIRTDGACLANGQQSPKAGWAIWHGERFSGENRIASGRLETKGPSGDECMQTSNRAELRAVVAALGLRHWPGEGFDTLVIATDSEYVVEGATKWTKSWIEYSWVKGSGDPVKNRDLWELLLEEVEKFKQYGMDIKFWRIPREWNTVTDAAAKEAAAQGEASDVWINIIGLPF